MPDPVVLNLDELHGLARAVLEDHSREDRLVAVSHLGREYIAATRAPVLLALLGRLDAAERELVRLRHG